MLSSKIIHKIKIIIALFYIIVVLSFLYFLLSTFTLKELSSYEFIKNNREYFFNLKHSNLILLSFILISLVIRLISLNIGQIGLNIWLRKKER